MNSLEVLRSLAGYNRIETVEPTSYIVRHGGWKDGHDRVFIIARSDCFRTQRGAQTGRAASKLPTKYRAGSLVHSISRPESI